jgi:endogenous inhibitor of DNA gyrase (YacG/DUF329 family)
VDLGKWFAGDYALASTDPADLEEALDVLDDALQKPH